MEHSDTPSDLPESESGILDQHHAVLKLSRDAQGARELGPALTRILDGMGADGRSRYRAELTAEEIFTNLVKYGGDLSRDGGDQIVELRVGLNPTELRVEILDRTMPYSPESSEPEPLGNNPARDGGLGLALVRRSCDALFYDLAEDGRNHLIAVFRRDPGEDERDRARLAGGMDDDIG